MSYVSGSDGSFWVDLPTPDGSVKLKRAARVANWSLTSNVELLPTTSLADTDATVHPGLRTTTGSCTLYYYHDGDGVNDAADILHKVIKQRESGKDLDPENQGIAATPAGGTIKLQVETEQGSRFIQGEVWFNSVAFSCAVGAVMQVEAQFQFKGAPTRVKI